LCRDGQVIHFRATKSFFSQQEFLDEFLCQAPTIAAEFRAHALQVPGCTHHYSDHLHLLVTQQAMQDQARIKAGLNRSE